MKILIKGFILAAIVIFCSLPAATAAGDREVGFNRSGYSVAGKYVSYLFDKNVSGFTSFTTNGSDSPVIWFNNITIPGFIVDISNTSGAVASYRQIGMLRGNNSIGVDIHDNRAGTILINTRQTVEAGAAQNLTKITKFRLKINVSLGGNVTLEKKYAGTLTINNTNNSTGVPPAVTFQPASNVNITGTDNGLRLQNGNREAYLSGVSGAGRALSFTFQENKILVDINNSFLLFRQSVSRNQSKNESLEWVVMQGVSEGKIGAEFFIESASTYDAVNYGSINASVDISEGDSAVLNVSSDAHGGTVLAVNLGRDFYNDTLNRSLLIEYDGNGIKTADNYTDIMDVSDDNGRAEYLIAAGDEGAVVLISVPGFSQHIISLKMEPPSGTFRASAARLSKPVSEKTGVDLPMSGRESEFSMWWIVTVPVVYTVFKGAIRGGK